jgi:hypothetical protein
MVGVRLGPGVGVSVGVNVGVIVGGTSGSNFVVGMMISWIAVVCCK